eukprot:scaffold62767_cov64-Phaeocystis_antarctica.AAC.1
MRRPHSGFVSSPSSSSSSSASSMRYRRSFTKHSDAGRVHSPLLAYHHHPARTADQRQPKSVARLQRLGVEGDDLVLRIVIQIGEYAEEQPTGHKRRAGDAPVLLFVARDLGSGVSEAADLSFGVSHIEELLAGANEAEVVRNLEAGTAAHVASKDAHRGSRAHHQLVATRYHRKAEHLCAEQILREVERHSCQAAPALASSLPAACPPRAHGGHRAILQLQRRQQVWHQVTREQHSLDRPLWQRLVRCKNGVGPILDIG